MEFAFVECEFKSRTKGLQKPNHRTLHQDKKIICTTCGFQTSRKGSFTTHQISVREGVKHQCRNCDYQATSKGTKDNKEDSTPDFIPLTCCPTFIASFNPYVNK